MQSAKNLFLIIVLLIQIILFGSSLTFAQIQDYPESFSVRERLLMDFGWRFALGHACDTEQDFDHGTGYFSYFAKTGYGDGPAAGDFDDRAWRIINLPHDWAVELPFDHRGSHSHGYRAIGRAFPENSIGWYRKHFFIPEADLGRRIVIEFDGVHRDAIIWVNGFYVGTEHSGYSSFQYDVTDYLNYGGNNVVAVRVDVTLEEGWFYEGAGIYRHVWLTKTSPLHVAQYGTFVTSELQPDAAVIEARTTVINEGETSVSFGIMQNIQEISGKSVASGELKRLILNAGEKKEYLTTFRVDSPQLWSLESPNLYQLVTTLKEDDSITDQYLTNFGIRSVRFDPNEGFFLNDQNIKLKGTNNHQDHAGVGTALPDALQEFRIARLKSMGCNAYRCSHNPPTPELLDACDRMGMLVLDENRLMGSSPEHIQQLERMILRDRNHPCVIAWSLGNEEWAIEGNIKGARIAATMQTVAQRLDPTRRITAASSGGWGSGISTVIDMMGFNYIVHGDIDEQHAKYPGQPGIGTEETTGAGTRGVYEDDFANGHTMAMDRRPGGASIETGLKYYAARPLLAGLFYWIGFDYRGEPNPIGWPQVSTQYGILDACGFPKDCYYYLKSWWTNEPVLHIFPHWNWEGKEKQPISVWTYSNCGEVELFLNGKSLGRKPMPRLAHLEWIVPYEPGYLLARGYQRDQEVISQKVETTGKPAIIHLIPERNTIRADGEDLAIITVQVLDDQARLVPTADNEVSFLLKGAGRILGAGNGDPASHEPDQFLETVEIEKITDLKMTFSRDKNTFPEVAFKFDDSRWDKFRQTDEVNKPKKDTLIIVRGSLQLPTLRDDIKVTLFTKSICENQSIYVNGELIAIDIQRNAPNQEFVLDHRILESGKNTYAVVGKPFVKTQRWEELNVDPGVVQVKIPAETWKRKVFDGLVQIIVQAARKSGEISLTAKSPGLKSATIKIIAEPANLRPALLSE